MAHFTIVLAAIAGVSYAVFRLLDHYVTARRAAAKAREWGCKEPKEEVFPGGLFASICQVRRALQADKEKVFPHWVLGRAEKLGVWTWKYKLFGSRIVVTNEPQNIQAILATQFGTFDLGPQRRNLVCERPRSPWMVTGCVGGLLLTEDSSGPCSGTASSRSRRRSGSTRGR